MRDWDFVLGASALAMLLGAWLAWRLLAWRERLRGRAHHARGKRGERDAERMLLARGYRISARQLRTSYEISVDGAPQRIELSVDFVVERGGEELIAEVKTGGSASLAKPDTRRQLLEYQLATGSRSMLLVDPEGDRITEVVFPLAVAPARSVSAWSALAYTLPLAAALLWWWSRSR